MKSFSIPSVVGSVSSLERAFAPTSLPSIIPQRGIVTTQAEYQLAHEWNAEAPTIGFVVGAAAIGVAYVVVKLLRTR